MTRLPSPTPPPSPALWAGADPRAAGQPRQAQLLALQPTVRLDRPAEQPRFLPAPGGFAPPATPNTSTSPRPRVAAGPPAGSRGCGACSGAWTTCSERESRVVLVCWWHSGERRQIRGVAQCRPSCDSKQIGPPASPTPERQPPSATGQSGQLLRIDFVARAAA